MTAAKRRLHFAVGVNGIGIGHAMRQLSLAEYLRNRGHEVTAIASGRAAPVFSDYGFRVLDGRMPMVIGKRDRLAMLRVLRDNLTTIPAILQTFAKTARSLSRAGVPDVFLTDYEPNAAWLSYMFRRPLVSIDQQSKYRYMDLPVVNGYLREVERKRLAMFMPVVSSAYVCAFSPLASPAAKVKVIPPILADGVLSAEKSVDTFSIAYFSRYFSEGPEVRTQQLVAAFRSLPASRRLIVYLPKGAAEALAHFGGRNVAIRAVDRGNFIRDLAACDSVFSNAGFNLIAEALHLGKPLYLCPLPTYDQQWCGRVIAGNGFGESHPECHVDTVGKFLDRAAAYREAIGADDLASWRNDPRPLVTSTIEERWA